MNVITTKEFNGYSGSGNSDIKAEIALQYICGYGKDPADPFDDRPTDISWDQLPESWKSDPPESNGNYQALISR